MWNGQVCFQNLQRGWLYNILLLEMQGFKRISVDSTHVSTEHHVVFSPSDCVDGVTTVGLLGVMRIKAISFLMSIAPPLRNSVILFLTFCDTVFLRPAKAWHWNKGNNNALRKKARSRDLIDQSAHCIAVPYVISSMLHLTEDHEFSWICRWLFTS